MANGFLQNSFRVGTPARGGGDLVSALLGINTNPDVQLKGQRLGAQLGNYDARTRRTNILSQQDAIELADMQELRDQFVKGSPERQAVIDPRFASGQRGLATRTDRLNKETSLANLADSGFTMNINGEQIPLADLINTMSGADFKAFATATPEVANILSKISNRDLGGVLDRDLTELKKLSEEERTKLLKEQVTGERHATKWKESRADMAKHSLAYAKKTERLKYFKERGELTKLSNQINKLALEINLKENERALLPLKNIDALVGTLQALKNLEDDEFDRAAYIKLYSKLYIDNVQKMTRRGKAPPADKVAKATEMAILSAFTSADKKAPNLDPDNPNNTIENLLKTMAPPLKTALAQILPELAQSGFNIQKAQELDRAKDDKVDLLAEADALQGQLQPGDVAPGASGVPSDEAALLSSLGLDTGSQQQLASGQVPPTNIQVGGQEARLGGIPAPADQQLLDSFIGAPDPLGRAEAKLPTPAAQPQVPKEAVTLQKTDPKLEKKIDSPQLDEVYNDPNRGPEAIYAEVTRLLATGNPKDGENARFLINYLMQKRKSNQLG